MPDFFSPLTFGYEWEILVLKRDLSFDESKDVTEISNKIRKEIKGSETGWDFVRGRGRMLEIRSGILKNAEELFKTTDAHIEIAKKECEKNGLVLLPSGVHPLTGSAIGLHVHVGSIYNIRDAKRISDTLFKYAPCFLALSVNSPFGIERQGEFKSYRILSHADFCAFPRAILPDALFHASWGDDVCVKTEHHSTIELRIGDGASSASFVKEYVAFFAAFAFGISEKDYQEINPKIYNEYITNRWRAARYGLQAVLDWDGEKIPVTELINKMFEKADFDSINAPEPRLLKKMVKKRKTQADWQQEIFRNIPDRFAYTDTFSKMLKQGDPFCEYIEKTEKMPPVDPEPIEEYLLSYIDKETPYRNLYYLLLMPYPLLDTYLEKLIKAKRIKVECDPKHGKRFTRIE